WTVTMLFLLSDLVEGHVLLAAAVPPSREPPSGSAHMPSSGIAPATARPVPKTGLPASLGCCAINALAKDVDVPHRAIHRNRVQPPIACFDRSCAARHASPLAN